MTVVAAISTALVAAAAFQPTLGGGPTLRRYPSEVPPGEPRIPIEAMPVRANLECPDGARSLVSGQALTRQAERSKERLRKTRELAHHRAHRRLRQVRASGRRHRMHGGWHERAKVRLAHQRRVHERARRDARERWERRSLELLVMGCAMVRRSRHVTASASSVSNGEGTKDQQTKEPAATARRSKSRHRPGRRHKVPRERRLGFAHPAQGWYTSRFGHRPGGFHHGLDIACAPGSSIRASKRGHVILAGRVSIYGRAIVIAHANGWSTLYAHLRWIGVSSGQRVGKHQWIGACGSSGHSTGPHLHFEIRRRGRYFNPHLFLGRSR